MIGLIWFVLMLAAGVVFAQRVFGDHTRQYKIMFGLAVGFTFAMWLPTLFAFATGFTAAAQYLALGTAFMFAGLSLLLKKKAPMHESEPPVLLVLCLVVPLAAFSCYLQYTHTFREIDGALYVGQSTYGDLCMHAGFATGFVNASFPPEYTILPGTRLGYPFLTDALSASMLCLGTDLSTSFVVPSSVMMALVYWSFILLAWRFTEKKSAVILAFLLMFLNGGLGFLYIKGPVSTLFGMTNENSVSMSQVMNGYYQAPANMPALNLRWVNVICDMLIPQRTLLSGWAVGIPILILLFDCVSVGKRSDFLRIGIWAGWLPMIHTHTFLAIGIISLGAMIYTCVAPDVEDRKRTAINFLIYGVVAAGIASWQLLKWTFPQSIGGGSLRFRFNWVNNNGDGTLKDGYIWFWLKNVGPISLVLLPAAFIRTDRTRKALGCGAVMLFAMAETILFQPNEYDNNKLFYIVYIITLPQAALLITEITELIGKRPLRFAAAAVFLYFSLTSGVLSLARETVSKYQIFSRDEVEAAEFLKLNTDRSKTVLTGSQHANAPAVLAGRNIVCGSASYLYYHGVDYADERFAEIEMYTDPAGSKYLFDMYDVGYVYLSTDHELSSYADDRITCDTVDKEYMDDNWNVIFGNDTVTIYEVK